MYSWTFFCCGPVCACVFCDRAACWESDGAIGKEHNKCAADCGLFLHLTVLLRDLTALLFAAEITMIIQQQALRRHLPYNAMEKLIVNTVDSPLARQTRVTLPVARS